MLTVISLSAAERQPQPLKKTKGGALDVLPAELRIELTKAISGPTLQDAMANIKRYYLAHPPSQKSVETTKAILTHLMGTFNLSSIKFKEVVNNLRKSSRMAVFQNPLMIQWIDRQIERLQDENRLRLAARNRDLKVVKELISKGVNVNAFDEDIGYTALDYALRTAKITRNDRNRDLKFVTEIVSDLLAAGAIPNRGEFGWALVGAVMNGSSVLVKMLLTAGANPNISDTHGDLPLIIAGRALLEQQLFGYNKADLIEIIKDLLKAGANPNAKSEVRRLTIKEYIERAEILTDQEKAELIDLLRKHGLKE
jgi:hypothetical protein